MSDEHLDLFGDPVRLPSGKRGRPAHQPTQKNRNKVMMLLALGWSNERIAAALHCSPPTLRRYYFSELKRRDIQRDRMDAWRFEKLVELTASGVLGAHRLLNQMIEKNDMVLNDARFRKDQGAAAKSQPLGKKERAEQLARKIADGSGEVSKDWGDDLRPGLH